MVEERPLHIALAMGLLLLEDLTEGGARFAVRSWEVRVLLDVARPFGGDEAFAVVGSGAGVQKATVEAHVAAVWAADGRD